MLRYVPFLFVPLAIALVGHSPGVEADRGVGVNLGRIDVQDRLKPGGSYLLPGLGVINTGDEAGNYRLEVTYVEGQNQRRPPPSWLEFTPERFFLAPGQSRTIDIRIELPSGATPGDYFAFIEARPAAEAEGVTVGVAAATRLTFTVEPSSWLAAQRLRVSRFLRDIEPWSYVVEGLILAGALAYLGRRYSPVRLRNPFERRH